MSDEQQTAGEASAEGILGRITAGEWDEPNFQRGEVSFQIRKIDAFQEDEILDDILEALGLSDANQLRYLMIKGRDPATEQIRSMAAVRLFLTFPKIKKRVIRERMFQHIYYQNRLTGEKWKPLREQKDIAAQPSSNENEAFIDLRGIDRHLVFYRSLYASFRDSFSSLG